MFPGIGPPPGPATKSHVVKGGLEQPQGLRDGPSQAPESHTPTSEDEPLSDDDVEEEGEGGGEAKVVGSGALRASGSRPKHKVLAAAQGGRLQAVLQRREDTLKKKVTGIREFLSKTAPGRL